MHSLARHCQAVERFSVCMSMLSLIAAGTCETGGRALFSLEVMVACGRFSYANIAQNMVWFCKVVTLTKLMLSTTISWQKAPQQITQVGQSLAVIFSVAL